MSITQPRRFEQILGIRFLDEGPSAALKLLEEGGLMVVPSAPGLATLPRAAHYRQALLESDFALVDSSFLALLWFLVHGKRLRRVSGLEFLRAFLAYASAHRLGSIFLVNPTDEDRDANIRLFHSLGISLSPDDCYTAPQYAADTAVCDQDLVAALERRHPEFVLLNIGGGTQEPLGLYLKNSLSFAPAIICTGAAIAFLSGRQAAISGRIDRLGLGWLARCISDPRRFVPRYVAALRLATIVARFGRDIPPLEQSAANSGR